MKRVFTFGLFLWQVLHPAIFAQIPTDGLVAFYPFNGNANDESGQNNNGIVHGATLTTDRCGENNKAYYFNGIDEYIEVPYNFSLTEVTVCGWIKADQIPQEGAIIFKTSEYFSDTWGLYLRDDLHILEDINDHNLQIYHTTITSDWHFFTAVLTDELVNKLYVDGVLVGTGQLSLDDWASYQGQLYIGQRGTSSWNGFFSGKIDDIRIYDRALSLYEIRQLYNTSCSNFGLCAFYPFNGNAHDESGNGNNGIVFGATLTTDRCGIPNSAYLFDGYNDYIELPSSVALNTDNSFSIVAWICNEAITSDGKYTNNAIYGQTDGYADNDYPIVLFEIWSDNNLRGAIRGIAPPSLDVRATNPLQNNTWYQVAMVRDAPTDSLYLYINGILVGSGENKLIGNTASNDAVSIGAYIDDLQTFYHFFCGKIDDVLIYNKELTKSEISNLYSFDCQLSAIRGESQVCQGQQNVQYAVNSLENVQYYWNYSGKGVTITGNSENVNLDFDRNSSDGILSVTVSRDNLSTQTTTLSVTVNPLPGDAGIINGEQSVCPDHGANYSVLPISNATSYLWGYDGAGTSIIENSNSVLIYFSEGATGGNLFVEGINSCGHGIRSSTFNISVIPCNNNPNDFEISIPNAFSPNGDGINDFFVISGLPENSQLIIFNRDGKELYASDNYQNDWNGKDKDGHILETGTYWFVFKLAGIQEEIKGFVYLKK